MAVLCPTLWVGRPLSRMQDNGRERSTLSWAVMIRPAFGHRLEKTSPAQQSIAAPSLFLVLVRRRGAGGGGGGGVAERGGRARKLGRGNTGKDLARRILHVVLREHTVLSEMYSAHVVVHFR